MDEDETTRKDIEEYIASIEDPAARLALEQMQFRVDRELRKYKNPVARMNKMIELFWEGFAEFDDALKPFRKK